MGRDGSAAVAEKIESQDEPAAPPRPPPARPDRREADRIVEAALARAAIYSDAQRQNVRWMADDLHAGRSVWSSVPFRILFEFNRRCNVQCVHCSIARAGTGELGIDVFERLLDQIGWGSIEVMPLLGGEPTLAPIARIAPIMRARNHYLNFITNGILFDRRFFAPIADVTARVQFSFHSHRRDVFQRIMPNADFDAVARNLAGAVRIAEKSQTQVVACIVPMFDMLEHLADWVRFVGDLGVPRVIVQNLYPQTHRRATLAATSTLSPERQADAYARALAAARAAGVFVETNVPELFGDPRNQPRTTGRFDILQDNAHIVSLYAPQFCISTALQIVIEWDGTVVPCIRDHIVLGNLHRTPFMDIWNGEAMQKLRRSHFDRKPSANCARCRVFYLGHP